MFVHTPVSADDPKQESIAGTIGSDVEFQAPYLIADLCIWDVEAIAGVETDTVRELSASYRYWADMTPGMYEGQRYDGVMRDIQGNHIALVKAGTLRNPLCRFPEAGSGRGPQASGDWANAQAVRSAGARTETAGYGLCAAH